VKSLLLRLAISTMVASAGWIAVGPGQVLVAAANTTQTKALDAASCGGLLALARADRPRLTPGQRAIVDHATVNSCRLITTMNHAQPTSQDALAGCSGFWVTFSYTIYWNNIGFDYLKDRVNGGFCSDGYWVSRDWGPDCQTTQFWLWGSANDWCGNYRPNGGAAPYLQMGHNFHIFPYSAPWINKYGYSRVEVYSNFGYSAWGACCYF